MESGLRFGSLGEGAAHIYVDMQNLFAPGTPWLTPTLPAVLTLAGVRPDRSFFTRFIPPRSQ